MRPQDYQFDVAFSFLDQDEALAVQLADLFEGRLKVFLYSRRQEQLAGTDGEKTFNDVFGRQARLVVVLYRSGWGQTPWTRIEETAIRNRAFDEGYSFVTFIPLDDKPDVPRWLPRTQIWIGLKRWGIDGAASVIDARIQELGGQPSDESLEHQAARVARGLEFAKNRESYLRSEAGARGANAAFQVLRDAVVDSVPSLQAAAPSLSITEKHVDNQVVLLSSGPALSIRWHLKYINTLNESSLDVSIWKSHPPYPGILFWEHPRPTFTLAISPDLSPSHQPAWAMNDMGQIRILSSEETAQFILKWWLDKALKHQD